MAATLLLVGTSSAVADDQRSVRTLAKDRAAATSSVERGLTGIDRSAFSVTGNFHHDGTADHLPPARHNIELVGELQVDTPANLRIAGTESDPVLPGQIADLAVYKNFAYLNSWAEQTCERGGTFIVDISNPQQPQQTGFLPALPERYHGEGAHAITLDTPAFQGDVLGVNNESCNPPAEDPLGLGGFDLYDVSNPRDPKTLVQGIGDTGPEGQLEGDFPTPNSSHSTFMWQGNDRRAYVVFVDNIELTDVDIFEITDPRNPQPVGEFDFVAVAAAQGVDIIDQGGLGGAADIFLHDMVVKKIGDRFIMMADYWDAGYLTFDVTNPAAPQYIADTTFDDPDPLTGKSPQEGNGHQGEFSQGNDFILAADEDFSPYRPGTFEISTGPEAGDYPSVSVGGGAAASFLPDLVMNGPTVYGGYGCDASAPIPPRATSGLPPLEEGEEAIVVLQRGPASAGDPPVADDPEGPEAACFPGEKAANGIEAGYDAVLLVNHHRGEAGGVSCGSGDFPAGQPIVTVCTSHEAFHHIFGTTPTTEIPYEPADEPDIGDLGEKVSADSDFDGWGYTHLYRAKTAPTGGKQVMEHIDSYAIDEALNPNYAFGFGDLSVHEFAADPTENVAYSSYYAGGMRVFTFSATGGLVEQGKFIDDEGSNFWGVEQFTGSDGQRYFAGSDRDFGLQIFRYTGPGAAQRPACTDSATMVPYKGSASVALPCSDANGNPLSRAISTAPTAGTVGAPGETVSYTHTGSTLGNADQFQFTANDGAATSAPATARIVTVPRDGGRCFNPFVGTAARESLTGSPFGDRISGGGGNDTVEGLGGADCLSGQGGRDTVRGGNGNDTVDGGSSRDRLFGGNGRDNLRGGGGNDDVDGAGGNDRGNGGNGNDDAELDSGNDRYSGGAGDDQITGGGGRDRLSGGGGDDRLDAGNGRNNTLSGGGGRDTLRAANGKRDRIRCGAGRDTVRADRNDRVARDCENVRRSR